MSSSFWQRLAPFLDVIGALLIFASWIASNALSQQAQSQANAHLGLIDRIRQFRLYDDFARRIAVIQADVARTRNLVQISAVAEKTESFPEALTWNGMTATQVRELNEFVSALEQYSERLSVSESSRQSLRTARKGVQDLSNEFNAAREEYNWLVTELDTNDTPPDNVLVVKEELIERVEQLWKKYDEAKQDMLHVGDELLQIAAAESEEANRLAARSKNLSYLLYVLGTVIILFGRAKKAHSAREKPVK